MWTHVLFQMVGYRVLINLLYLHAPFHPMQPDNVRYDQGTTVKRKIYSRIETKSIVSPKGDRVVKQGIVRRITAVAANQLRSMCLQGSAQRQP